MDDLRHMPSDTRSTVIERPYHYGHDVVPHMHLRQIERVEEVLALARKAAEEAAEQLPKWRYRSSYETDKVYPRVPHDLGPEFTLLFLRVFFHDFHKLAKAAHEHAFDVWSSWQHAEEAYTNTIEYVLERYSDYIDPVTITEIERSIEFK